MNIPHVPKVRTYLRFVLNKKIFATGSNLHSFDHAVLFSSIQTQTTQFDPRALLASSAFQSIPRFAASAECLILSGENNTAHKFNCTQSCSISESLTLISLCIDRSTLQMLLSASLNSSWILLRTFIIIWSGEIPGVATS